LDIVERQLYISIYLYQRCVDHQIVSPHPSIDSHSGAANGVPHQNDVKI